MWFRMGGERSERQWRDIVGILRVSSELIDREYLMRSATQAGVADLLTQAVNDMGST